MFDYYEKGLSQERVELLKTNSMWRDYREYLLKHRCIVNDETLYEELDRIEYRVKVMLFEK